jgi:hypothetical protein
MPRAGHLIGPRGCPPHLAHYEARLGIRMSASKLTKGLRTIAQTDSAVAQFLKSRIREEARFTAFLAGQASFKSDTECARCGSTTRTVYCASCHTCQTTRRPLRLDRKNRIASWPPALRSRAGWLAICEERKRERGGEHSKATFGPFTAISTPTGRLSIEAPSLNLAIPDLSRHEFEYLNNIVRRHPEFLELLRWARWI